MNGGIDFTRDTWSLDVVEWERCMDYYGMNAEFREAITGFDHEDLRQSQSCAFWVKGYDPGISENTGGHRLHARSLFSFAAPVGPDNTRDERWTAWLACEDS